MASSSDDEDAFLAGFGDDVFEDSPAAAARREAVEARRDGLAEWRKERARQWEASAAGATLRELRLGPAVVRYEESFEQQRRVWDCAFVLAHHLARRPADFFRGRSFAELGCGVGLPGLAAAALGAGSVWLTDLPLATESIARNIELSGLGGVARAGGLSWGSASVEGLEPVDVVLCSDLIYGDREAAAPLVQTVSALSAPRTLVLSAHERRVAGDGGASFFELMAAAGFEAARVPASALDEEYKDEGTIEVWSFSLV